ncbi:MAG: aconitase X catalytic domain-containing protein [Gemmataceae bacterium]|nr:aconitase X catalytic domain-containing protein [Gemmataceae bacterium]
MSVTLTADERAVLAGGGAAALAMRLMVRYADMLGADRLLGVTGAHIDGCLYHGRASLDFAERLVALGGTVRVPTTLNVSSLDRLHPELYRGDSHTAAEARRLMDAYEALGCRPTWTCAPYQQAARPGLGEQVAWAESNAIVFANSVLGARTNRYGDFLDICAALTGRVPDCGLHRAENRLARVRFDLAGVSPGWFADGIGYALVGLILGLEAGTAIPAIVGLPTTATEDDLKSVGATAASSGSVAMFHAVGLTPEAPTLDAAFGGTAPERARVLTDAEFRAALDRLNTLPLGSPLTGVSLGTPHFSAAEFARLLPLLAGKTCHPAVEFYVSTARQTLAHLEATGGRAELTRFGARVVVDTCTYVTPILKAGRGVGAVMTNSGKWAHYAPANLGVRVAFGGLRECVASAVEGRVCRG